MIQKEAKTGLVLQISSWPDIKITDPVARKIIKDIAKDNAYHFNTDGWSLRTDLLIADFIQQYFNQDILQSIFSETQKLVPDVELVGSIDGLKIRKKEVIYTYYNTKSDKIVTKYERSINPDLEYLGCL